MATLTRIQWQFETPGYTWGNPFELKRLSSAELWIDRLVGTVNFYVYYRPGGSACFYFWHAWQDCTARDCREDTEILCPDSEYPQQPYCPQYRATMVLPEPPVSCDENNIRPSNLDYTFQLKIAIRGSCRIRGILVHAYPVERAPFEGVVC